MGQWTYFVFVLHRLLRNAFLVLHRLLRRSRFMMMLGHCKEGLDSCWWLTCAFCMLSHTLPCFGSVDFMDFRTGVWCIVLIDIYIGSGSCFEILLCIWLFMLVVRNPRIRVFFISQPSPCHPRRSCCNMIVAVQHNLLTVLIICFTICWFVRWSSAVLLLFYAFCIVRVVSCPSHLRSPHTLR